MANIPGNLFHAPKFLKASSPEELEKAMILNNSKWNSEFKYFDIQNVSRKWYAWYYFDYKQLRNTTKTNET